jgi:hypothetical protein
MTNQNGRSHGGPIDPGKLRQYQVHAEREGEELVVYGRGSILSPLVYRFPYITAEEINARAAQISLEQMHDALTAALPLAGSRRLGDGGQTVQELRVEASFASALRVPVHDTYRWPLRSGVTAVPELDRDALAEWMRGEFATAAGQASTGNLADVLTRYFTRSFEVGGELALDLLGSQRPFQLRDEDLVELIEETAVSYTDPYADISLTNTTANELARQIANGREAGLSASAIEGLLTTYIGGRALTRSSNIATTEMVSWSRKGVGTTYGRNGVEYMIYKTSRSRRGPCPICAPYDGQRLRASNGLVWFDLLPQHGGCVCYYLPDTAGWELPEEIWTG